MRAWYDPSDYSTLFTDSAGTTPVTAVEQFVGLMLDKSKGLVLGSELATGILGSTSGWTFVGAANVTGGAIVFNTPPSTNASAQYNPIVASGKWYQSTITITGTGQATVQLGSAGTTVTLVAPGTYTFRGLASGGTGGRWAAGVCVGGWRWADGGGAAGAGLWGMAVV
jgi:hypothetical protein